MTRAKPKATPWTGPVGEGPSDAIPARVPITRMTPRQQAVFEKCRARWPDFALHHEEYRTSWGVLTGNRVIVSTCTVAGKPYEMSLIETLGVDCVYVALVGAACAEDP